MGKFFGLVAGLSFLATFGLIYFLHSQSDLTENSFLPRDHKTRQRRDVESEEDVTSGRIEFPELFNGTFSYSRYSGKRWSKVDPEEYFLSDSEMIKKVKFDLELIKSGKTEEDFTFSTFLKANWRDLCGEKTCTDYQISADEKYIFTQEKL